MGGWARCTRAVALLALVAGVLVGSFLVLGTGPASAQDQPDVPIQSIIPRPNSGHKPIDSGDLGGSLQLGLLGLTCAVLAGGTLHLVHQSRKARGLTRAQRNAAPGVLEGADPPSAS